MNPYTDHPDQSGTDLEEPGLSALYHQGATQTPRSDLDRRILDQAQAALRSGPGNVRQSGPRHWHWHWHWRWHWSWRWLWSKCRNGLPRWPWSRSGTWNWRQVAIPLSSVAGLLLAVGLVLRVLEEQSAMQGISGMAPRELGEDRLSQQSQPPQPSTSTQPPQPPQPTQPIKQSQSTPQSHSTSPSKPEREVAAKRALGKASPRGPPARLSPPAPAPVSVPAHDDKAPVIDEGPQADPERWLAVIRQQWSSGQRAEAIRQLTAFRQVHPRYPLPADLAPLMEAE